MSNFSPLFKQVVNAQVSEIQIERACTRDEALLFCLNHSLLMIASNQVVIIEEIKKLQELNMDPKLKVDGK